MAYNREKINRGVYGMELANNITDTALIFEGGGMRASYTAGFLSTLLENELYFDYVAGISAGASHSVNYLSRDTERAKKSFVDIVLEPEFGGWMSLLKGEGYFRARYIYEETHYPDAALPLDFDTFMANPARLRIGTFDMESGEMSYFTKENVQTVHDLVKIVRSSSTLPFFMQPTQFQNRIYLDGGIGNGIALEVAQKDGFKKYFAVLTRPRGFRKKPFKVPAVIKAYFRKHPHLADSLLNSHVKYNRTLDELEQLESAGKAFLACPETMPVKSMETNLKRLQESYRLGYAQGRHDLPRWKEFLGIS